MKHATGALSEAAAKEQAKPKHKGKSHVHRMEIRRTHPSGYIAQHKEHRFEDGAQDHDRDMAEGGIEHALPGPDELQQHISDNMGAGGAAPDAGAGAAGGAEEGAPQ